MSSHRRTLSSSSSVYVPRRRGSSATSSASSNYSATTSSASGPGAGIGPGPGPAPARTQACGSAAAVRNAAREQRRQQQQRLPNSISAPLYAPGPSEHARLKASLARRRRRSMSISLKPTGTLETTRKAVSAYKNNAASRTSRQAMLLKNRESEFRAKFAKFKQGASRAKKLYHANEHQVTWAEEWHRMQREAHALEQGMEFHWESFIAQLELSETQYDGTGEEALIAAQETEQMRIDLHEQSAAAHRELIEMRRSRRSSSATSSSSSHSASSAIRAPSSLTSMRPGQLRISKVSGPGAQDSNHLESDTDLPKRCSDYVVEWQKEEQQLQDLCEQLQREAAASTKVWKELRNSSLSASSSRFSNSSLTVTAFQDGDDADNTDDGDSVAEAQQQKSDTLSTTSSALNMCDSLVTATKELDRIQDHLNLEHWDHPRMVTERDSMSDKISSAVSKYNTKLNELAHKRKVQRSHSICRICDGIKTIHDDKEADAAVSLHRENEAAVNAMIRTCLSDGRPLSYIADRLQMCFGNGKLRSQGLDIQWNSDHFSSHIQFMVWRQDCKRQKRALKQERLQAIRKFRDASTKLFKNLDDDISRELEFQASVLEHEYHRGQTHSKLGRLRAHKINHELTVLVQQQHTRKIDAAERKRQQEEELTQRTADKRALLDYYRQKRKEHAQWVEVQTKEAARQHVRLMQQLYHGSHRVRYREQLKAQRERERQNQLRQVESEKRKREAALEKLRLQVVKQLNVESNPDRVMQATSASEAAIVQRNEVQDPVNLFPTHGWNNDTLMLDKRNRLADMLAQHGLANSSAGREALQRVSYATAKQAHAKRNLFESHRTNNT
jgi:hypothetical protein